MLSKYCILSQHIPGYTLHGHIHTCTVHVNGRMIMCYYYYILLKICTCTAAELLFSLSMTFPWNNCPSTIISWKIGLRLIFLYIVPQYLSVNSLMTQFLTKTTKKKCLMLNLK